jgi:OOP family OmpA-OmpF porin
VIGGFWAVSRFIEGRRVDAYVQSLHAEPGFVVTNVERRGGTWHISGLRDPLATDPAVVLAATNLNPARVEGHWEPFQALDAAMTLKRLSATLDPPRSVSFVVEGEAIRARGSAPQHWLERARAFIAQQPAGAVQVDLSAITDIQDPTFVRLREAIQARIIRFNPNAPRPAPDQEPALDALAGELRELNEVANNLGFSVQVMIVGHTDTTGSEMANLSLSAARAEVTRSMLRARGIAPDQLLVRSTGTLEPVEFTGLENLAMNRSVTFTVSTSD